MLSGSVVDVGISQRSDLPLISPQDSQDSGQKKKKKFGDCTAAACPTCQKKQMVKWLLLVGDGGKTQTKSESHWIGVYLYREPTVRQNQKILQTVQRRTQFSIHMCVLVSNSYHSLYFLLWWYIYIRTTCCLLCTFAQVHAEIEIICRCYDLQGIEYISFINYDQIKCHSLSMGPWLLIFFSFRKRMPATESQLDLKV